MEFVTQKNLYYYISTDKGYSWEISGEINFDTLHYEDGLFQSVVLTPDNKVLFSSTVTSILINPDNGEVKNLKYFQNGDTSHINADINLIQDGSLIGQNFVKSTDNGNSWFTLASYDKFHSDSYRALWRTLRFQDKLITLSEDSVLISSNQGNNWHCIKQLDDLRNQKDLIFSAPSFYTLQDHLIVIGAHYSGNDHFYYDSPDVWYASKDDLNWFEYSPKQYDNKSNLYDLIEDGNYNFKFVPENHILPEESESLKNIYRDEEFSYYAHYAESGYVYYLTTFIGRLDNNNSIFNNLMYYKKIRKHNICRRKIVMK